MSQINCPQLAELYQELTTLKSRFDADLTRAQTTIKTKDIFSAKLAIKDAKDKRSEMTKTITEIQQQLGLILVLQGVDKKISIKAETKKWNEFYQKYKIKDDQGKLCQLPANLRLTSKALAEAKRCIEQYGFDKILLIPAGISPANLVANQKFLIFDDPAAEADQNSNKSDPIHIEDEVKVKKSALWNKKTAQPEVIFLKNKDHVDSEVDATIQKIKVEDKDLLTNVDRNYSESTRDHGFDKIIEMENHLHLRGLDLFQAMILDRQYFDQTKRHLFDWRKDNATWLTETKDQAVIGRCSRFYWSPGSRWWEVYLSGDSHYDDILGSVFTSRLETAER